MQDLAIRQRVERPTFLRHGNGRITVDRFPDVIGIDDRLLAEADPERLRLDGDVLTIVVDNGTASYHIVDRDPAEQVTYLSLHRLPALDA